MSSFGSSGGRGGRSGGGRGRGSSRGSGRGRGGSSHHNNAGQGGQQGRGTSGVGAEAGRPRFKPCRAFTTTGSCPAGPGCTFSHVVQKHAELDATSPLPQPKNSSNYNNNGGYHNHNRNNNNNNNNNNEAHPVSGIALWEAPAAAPGQPAVIKVFNGSHDGHWRLWEPENGAFVRRFEHSMGGGGCKVECVKVASNFLFCGFEGVSRKLPHVKVGMIHAWNLANPSEAPLEFHIHEEFTPYAHAAGVSCLHITKETSQIISGCHNGVLRTWNYDGAQNKFVLQHTLSGHAGEITGLTTISPGGTAGAPPILWSGSTDCSIRLWDLTTGNCQYLITSETAATTDGAPMPTHASPNAGAPSTGPGHTEAITSLLALESPAGNFVLSSSLDGSVKAWNGSNGTCMASEMHGEGVVSMALATDPKGNPLLLLGLQEGIIMCRSVLQTPTTPAFTFLFALMPRYTIGHAGPVKSIEAGPASTFYTGGHDGKLLIFQITADLGL